MGSVELLALGAVFSFLAAIAIYVFRGGPLKHEVHTLTGSMEALKGSMDRLSEALAGQAVRNESIEHRLTRLDDHYDTLEARVRTLEIGV